MKKIKLTESDLTRIVKRLIRENEEDSLYMIKSSLINIKNRCEDMLGMIEVGDLTDMDEWAKDHITTSRDDIEEVHNWILGGSVEDKDGMDM
jgi:hypothetical protein